MKNVGLEINRNDLKSLLFGVAVGLAMILAIGVRYWYEDAKFNHFAKKQAKIKPSSVVKYDELDERNVSAEFRFRAYLGEEPMNYLLPVAPKLPVARLYLPLVKKFKLTPVLRQDFR